jgi:hypothetical protein
MQLQDLYIHLAHTDLSWDALTLQENTLRTLEVNGNPDLLSDWNFKRKTSFIRSFVPTQWQSLTTLCCQDLPLAMDQAINLPNVGTLELDGCRVEGWEHLCNSVTMLKNLRLFSVDFVGLRARDILSVMPIRVRWTIESLNATSTT